MSKLYPFFRIKFIIRIENEMNCGVVSNQLLFKWDPILLSKFRSTTKTKQIFRHKSFIVAERILWILPVNFPL